MKEDFSRRHGDAEDTELIFVILYKLNQIAVGQAAILVTLYFALCVLRACLKNCVNDH